VLLEKAARLRASGIRDGDAAARRDAAE
jgi:hypothetical protein